MGKREFVTVRQIVNGKDIEFRRTGVFKKASELTTLYGVDLVVIMFSPGMRVFSFNNPSVDSIIQCYMTQGPPILLNLELNEDCLDEHELHMHLKNLSNKIVMEKKHTKDFNGMLNVVEEHF
ncbi:hypothetical protein JHK86_027448 [Glycine max]|nr:hypothetical protein JHK86_027448 [Glycine max]